MFLLFIIFFTDLGRILDELPDELGIITSGSGSPAIQPGAVDSVSSITLNGVVDIPPLQKTIDPVLLKQQNQNLSQLLSSSSSGSSVNITNGNPPSSSSSIITNTTGNLPPNNSNIKPPNHDNQMIINAMQQPQQMMNNISRPSMPLHQQLQMQNNPGIVGQLMNEPTSHQIQPRLQMEQIHSMAPQQQQQQQQQAAADTSANAVWSNSTKW